MSIKNSSSFGVALALLTFASGAGNASSLSPEARLSASDAKESDRLGASLALSGNTAIVGAHFHENSAVPDIGAAYVFVQDGEGWKEEAQLRSASVEAEEEFGARVAADGDTVLVSGHQGVYVFVRDSGSWSQEAILSIEDGWARGFGYRLAISGDVALIGAPWSDEHAGSAFVFTRSAGHWQQEALLQASDAR